MKEALCLDQGLSRTNSNNQHKHSKTAALNFSRNNFKQENEEDCLSPAQALTKLQTVETPFKMTDVMRDLKLGGRSNSVDKDHKNHVSNHHFPNKIGKSFLGSSINGSLGKPEAIGPHCFKAHQLLGTGSFGEVFLVEEISTSELYAMKVLSKEKINEQNLLKYAFAEKDIMRVMTKIEHPFVVKIKYTF